MKMHAPGSERSRSDALLAPEPEFTMTAAHLARTMDATRKRERVRIAAMLDDRADLVLSQGKLDLSQALREIAEDVRSTRSSTLTTTRIAADAMPPGDRDPLLDDIDSKVADAEAQDHGGLPPVRHHDDFAEGEALVRRRAGAAQLRGMRD